MSLCRKSASYFMGLFDANAMQAIEYDPALCCLQVPLQGVAHTTQWRPQ